MNQKLKLIERVQLLSNLRGRHLRVAIAIVVLACGIRVAMFYTIYPAQRHGAAGAFGSAAVSIYLGGGLTTNDQEVSIIENLPNNYSGNYLSFHTNAAREPFTEFLPGPPILIALLWSLIPKFNFAPYVFLQCVIDAGLIGCFYLVFESYNRIIALTTTAMMVLDVASIKRTLMVGYDFWPQFTVLVTFIGILGIVGNPDRLWRYTLLGLVSAITIWFRDLTTFLPFAVTPMLVWYLRGRVSNSFRRTVFKAFLYLLPLLISLGLLSFFRFETTGSYRPTRSTFWHSVMVGICQFPNPFGLASTDTSVWNYAKSINRDLERYKLADMYKLPNSPYEETVKQLSLEFIKLHPWLFVRNALYRIGIMISPLLYRDGDFIPQSVGVVLLPVAIVSLLLWFIGLFRLLRSQPALFWLCASVYVYFFGAFGWFYVIGRVILPFLFINCIMYLYGIEGILRTGRARLMAGHPL